MLTPQQTRERVLSAIKNNPKGVVNALGRLSPQMQSNMQMRNFLDSLPLSLRNSTSPPPENFSDATGFKFSESGRPYPFRLPVESWPPNSGDSKNALQEAAQKITLDLANKRDAVLMSAITLALGTAKWDLADLLPRLSVQRQGKAEVVFLDENELIRFNEPELIIGADHNGKAAYVQSFQVMMDVGK